jgi:hypothetical protein
MESKATKYHLEINGISEGPMSAKLMAWKIAAAQKDDIILFRAEGSGVWHPLETHREMLQQLVAAEGSSEEPAPAPPKLKLKKRGEATAASTPATPAIPPETQAASFETPPPPPGAPDGADLNANFGYTDDNPPPPPPGVPMAPAGANGEGIYTAPPPLLSQNPNGAPPLAPTPSAPQLPPVQTMPLLVIALVVTVSIVSYIIFFMQQDVAGSAKLSNSTGGTREVSGMKYTVLTKRAAEAWKAATLVKLTELGNKAKAEATTADSRAKPLLEKAREATEKYQAHSRALLLVGINGKILGISFNASSSTDVKLLRTLEAALEIAEPHLKAAARDDLDKGRYNSLGLNAKIYGFPNLTSAYEAEIGELETKLQAELTRIQPVVEETIGYSTDRMYTVPASTPAVTRGTTDALGLFDPKIAPGEYYIIGNVARDIDAQAAEWAVAFEVKPLTENSLPLNDLNLRSLAPTSLWKAGETLKIDQDIATIRKQAVEIEKALKQIQETRKNIERNKAELDRLWLR